MVILKYLSAITVQWFSRLGSTVGSIGCLLMSHREGKGKGKRKVLPRTRKSARTPNHAESGDPAPQRLPPRETHDKCNIKNISLKHLVKVIKNAIHRVIIIVLPITYNNTVEDLKWSYKSEGNKKEIQPLKDLVPAWRNEYIIIVFELLPTPPNTPLKYLFTAVLIAAILKNALSKNLLNV